MSNLAYIDKDYHGCCMLKHTVSKIAMFFFVVYGASIKILKNQNAAHSNNMTR